MTNDFLVRVVECAESEAQMLTDEYIPANATPRERARGNQLHRRAVAGKRLEIHLHERDIFGGQVALSNGEMEAMGSTKITLRVTGQSIDLGQPIFCSNSSEAHAVCDALKSILWKRPVPVPADHYYSAYSTAFGDEIATLPTDAQKSYAAYEAAIGRLGSARFAFGVAWWAHKHAEMAATRGERGNAGDRY